MRKQSGFTLIELLVVIAIISLLISILVPSLGRVKKQAQCVICMAHLRQLVMAWHTYSTENNDRVIGAVTSVNPDDKWTYGSTGDTGKAYAWVCSPQTENGQDRTSSSTLEEKKIGIKKGLLWPYLQKIEVYHCASDKRCKDAPTDTDYSGVGGYRSYSIVGGMNGEEHVYFTRLRKITKMKSPGTKYVMLEEADGRGYNMNSWILDPDMQTAQWDDPVAIWHGNFSTLGFADGHVEKHKWLDEETIEAARSGTNCGEVDLHGKDLRFVRKFFPYDKLN